MSLFYELIIGNATKVTRFLKKSGKVYYCLSSKE
jgi:tRNA U55 pseudouridine synthase TruB